ncbi:MAG: phospholipase D-like domain-containing protein [Ktedonobacteraceae bacterium]
MCASCSQRRPNIPLLIGWYTQCLAGGIRLLLYQPIMVHAKTATIDGVWSSTIGTANLDRLSLVSNFEVNKV